jgi:hypothetical protein
MSAAEESQGAPRGSEAVVNDPWGHEPGEGERGVPVGIHPTHRPEPVAQLIGDPARIAPGHLRALLAILVTTALAAATVVVAVQMDWI